ncbi:DUF2239 family protein [Solimonas sp. SE-A11]|uniref:DUF2239 family protein n=1 Tax=Solimonas sp. SE-A11 TaxID=3054954 RepID=UPI00259CF9CD|nr:DUF2239 family protein [Solimonas sp. SE-A11]MDM4772782.1 DUF2239 family protein [Solimonas sp. SE-A11]
MTPSFTAFDGPRRLTSGPLSAVALVVRRALAQSAPGPVLIFNDDTGRSIDVDLRGSDEELAGRLAPATPEAAAETAKGRGRPKLGVVAREVTLLPRHWEWLSAQPGGASVALRKLVEEARRAQGDKGRERQAQERAYHFMSAMAGDLPGYEEAIRALFAGDRARFAKQMEAWPQDLREHALMLAAESAE